MSGIVAIVMQQPLFLLVSFGWIMIPWLYDFIIVKPIQLFWLLLISLPLSTELNITPQLGLDFPDETLLMLLTGIAIVQWIHRPQWFPRSLKKHPLFFWLVVYMLWIFICCLYAAEPLLSFKFLLAKTWYIIPFVVLPQYLLTTKTALQKAAIFLLVPMLFVVIQTLLRHASYHFSFESVKQILFPFFRNHVNYSSMLVCLLPAGWCMWKLTPVTASSKRWIGLGLLAGLAGLFFAYSRGAWAALFLGIMAIVIIRKKWMKQLVILAVTGILISTSWLITDNNYLRFAPDHDKTIFHTDFREHLQATIEMKDVSTAERFYRWIAGFKMLAARPVTGFGPNAFYLHYRPYTVNRFETWVSDNKEHSTVHNYFILVALEQGLIGLILFCVLYFGMLMHAQRLYHRLLDPFYKTIALTTGIVLTMIGVINSMSDMIETDKIGSIFWLCLGVIILLDQKSKEENKNGLTKLS